MTKKTAMVAKVHAVLRENGAESNLGDMATRLQRTATEIASSLIDPTVAATSTFAAHLEQVVADPGLLEKQLPSDQPHLARPNVTRPEPDQFGVVRRGNASGAPPSEGSFSTPARPEPGSRSVSMEQVVMPTSRPGSVAQDSLQGGSRPSSIAQDTLPGNLPAGSRPGSVAQDTLQGSTPGSRPGSIAQDQPPGSAFGSRPASLRYDTTTPGTADAFNHGYPAVSAPPNPFNHGFPVPSAPPSPAVLLTPSDRGASGSSFAMPASSVNTERGVSPSPAPPSGGAAVEDAVDLCILMDCTSGMNPWIRACASDVGTLEALLLPAATRVNVAFVGYRDYNYAPNDRITSIDFVPGPQIERLQVGLQNVSALTADDSDWCEDMAGGLDCAARLQWRSPNRLLMLFADAPPHGTRFHASQPDLNDHYPQGDPQGLDPAQVIQHFAKHNINVCFVAMHESTVDCQEVFRQAYVAAGGRSQANYWVRPCKPRDSGDIGSMIAKAIQQVTGR